jgi:hypothetical protein
MNLKGGAGSWESLIDEVPTVPLEPIQHRCKVLEFLNNSVPPMRWRVWRMECGNWFLRMRRRGIRRVPIVHCPWCGVCLKETT